jgi:hypothetical protein
VEIRREEGREGKSEEECFWKREGGKKLASSGGGSKAPSLQYQQGTLTH